MTRAEPTHQQLLEALERLFQATEEQCDLPETVTGVQMGIRWQRSRTERLCPGYGKRQMASEHDLAVMIYHLYLVVIMQSLDVYQLRARPDRALAHECIDVAAAWSHCHPQPTQEQGERLHELNDLTQGRGFYPDEYRQERIDSLLAWFQGQGILFNYDGERRVYRFANRG